MTKAVRAAPSAEQQSLWGGWNHVVRRGRVVKATPTPHPQPTLKPSTAPKEAVWPVPSRRSEKPPSPEPRRPLRRSMQLAQMKRPPLLSSWPRSPLSSSPLSLPCRKSLISITSHSVLVWRWLIGFSQHSPPHRGSPSPSSSENRSPLHSRLWQRGVGRRTGNPCDWHADGVRGRRVRSRSRPARGRHISPQSKPSGLQTMCATAQTETQSGGTAILVRLGIGHYTVPVLGLRNLEATAIHIVLGCRQAKILAVYLSQGHSGLTKVPVHSNAFRSCDYATLGWNPRKTSNQSMPSHICVF